MANYSKYKKVAIAGAAGGGLYYVARFFYLLGVEIVGYDVAKTQRYEELEKLGIKMFNENPEVPFEDGTEAYFYTEAYPDELIKKLKHDNPEAEGIEVGVFFNELVDDYEAGRLSADEKKAFIESNIAPLYQIDFNKMKYIAVTGTDGKTTTTSMIYHILKSAGFKPAMVTTVSAKIGDEEIDTGFHVTSPPAQDMYKFIKKIEDAGCTHVVIEATSHGLSMGRLAGAKFDVAVYTNITEEHLDYHKDWNGLFEAKSLLIRKHLKKNGVAVLNCDDERSFGKLKELANTMIVYGWKTDKCKKDAYLTAEAVEINDKGISFQIAGYVDKWVEYDVRLNILGDYNISNALAAIGASIDVGVAVPDATKALSSFQTVTGRMQILQKKPFKVIVDFAHTPGGLENALKSVKKLATEAGGRLIAMFGCAGKRDRYKRAKMGKIAAELADVTIITAEDPRTEKLTDINDAIEEGWKSTGKTEEGGEEGKGFYRFDDDSKNVKVRRDAIKKALGLAQPGDVVIILGKSHEKSLCFGLEEYPWNDIEETEKLLKK